MVYLDANVLMGKMNQMTEDACEGIQDKRRKIIALLAGDKNALRKTSLEDIARMFNHAGEILGIYWESTLPQWNLDSIPTRIRGKRRRAV